MTSSVAPSRLARASAAAQAPEAQFKRVVQALWKRRWIGVATAWLVALVAIPAVMVVPDRHEASAQIYVDTQTVLKPLLRDLAYTPDIDQQVRMLARTLISRPNLAGLLDRVDVGQGASKDSAVRDRVISRLMDQIKVTPVGTGTMNLYSITYRDTDPAQAKRVVEGTLNLFVNAGLHGQKRDSEEASQFIDEQIKVYEAKLVEAENRLKEFKVRNFGVSGVASQDFFSRMSTLADEVSKLKVELASAEQSREAYRRELAAESPQLPVDAVAGGGGQPVVSEVESRLQAQQKVLDELLRRYTEEHPDVVSSRRVIAQLEAQKRQEEQKRAAALAAGNLKAAATSPVYQKIRISLAETEALVASLRSQLALKESRLEQVRAAAGRVPQIEAELAQLNRDYDVMHKNYETLVARRESASIGVRLDESSRLADFRVVEPPQVSPKAVFPARVHVAAAAALLALALGIAVPILLDRLAPTFRDAESLQRSTGRQVLGSIGLKIGAAERRNLRTQGVGVALACAGLLMVQAGWVAWLFTRTSA
jgi:polysaccharide chain length determinant protein (PEP-CTERM system associated)